MDPMIAMLVLIAIPVSDRLRCACVLGRCAGARRAAPAIRDALAICIHEPENALSARDALVGERPQYPEGRCVVVPFYRSGRIVKRKL
jgi:hypothetical protein